MKRKQKLTLVKNENQPLTEQVFAALHQGIVEGILKPGERIMEIHIADELGVSRTPVREAISKLELEGLVVTENRKGAYVKPMTIIDIKELHQIRGSLEALASKLAAQNATQEEIDDMIIYNQKFEQAVLDNDDDGIVKYDILFHDTIYKAGRNLKLTQMISSVREQMQRLRVEYVHMISNKTPLIGQHKDIIKNIVEKNPQEAYEAAIGHIKISEDDMVRGVEEKSDI